MILTGDSADAPPVLDGFGLDGAARESFSLMTASVMLPIGQFVGWLIELLRRSIPRLKLAGTLAFLVTPILAGPLGGNRLVGLLLLITRFSGLSWRCGARNLPCSAQPSSLLVTSLLLWRLRPRGWCQRQPIRPIAAGADVAPLLRSPQPGAWENPRELLRLRGPCKLGPRAARALASASEPAAQAELASNSANPALFTFGSTSASPTA